MRSLAFAEYLSFQLGHPVLDRTGLTGAFEIKVEWVPDQIPSREQRCPNWPKTPYF
jgi:uncharacterized protein (TIGR03435 family)